MKFETLKKIEKMCFGVIIVLSVFTVIAIAILFNKVNNIQDFKLDVSKFHDEVKDKTANELSFKKNIFPTNCNLNSQIPNTSFVREDGTKLNIRDLKGKTVILTFWASWCTHCSNEMKHSQEFLEILKKYENVEFILVNKLDGVKETKEQALNYLKENNIPFSTVFDENLEVYNELGIKVVPTTLIINKDGVVKSLNPGEIEDSGTLETLIQNVLKENS